MRTLLEKIQSTYILNLLTILFFVGIILYSNTLVNGLFFDDEQFIYENTAVVQFQPSQFFTQSLITGGGQLSNYYRPLLFTAFSLEYQLFGPAGFIFHLTSLLIHTGGAILLFLFLIKLFKNRPLAFLTSLFWLIHPLQTEAVSYASGMGDPLSFFFVLLTLYLSLFNTRKTTVFAYLSFVCALLSKEIALITPGLLFLTHLVAQQKLTKQTLVKSFFISFPYILIAASYFSLRLTILNFANTLNFYGGENLYSGNLLIRLNTFFHLLPTYLSLLFYPKELFMERDMVIDVATRPTILSLTSFIGMVGVGALGIWFFVKKHSPYLLFASTWFMVSFVPTMGIIPINGIFYEHFLYFPSVGFFLLLSFLFLKLIINISSLWQNVALSGLLIALVLLSTRTVARNAEWRDPITFYQQTLSHAPSARIYNNLAMSYAEEGQQQKAVEVYNKSLALSDFYPETHYNLGNSYTELGQIDKAEREYKKALELNPTFYRAYIALFSLYKVSANAEGQDQVINEVNTLAKKYPSFTTLVTQLQAQR